MEEQQLVDPMIRIQVLESIVGGNAIMIAQQTATVEMLSLENQRLIQESDSLREQLTEFEVGETSKSDEVRE